MTAVLAVPTPTLQFDDAGGGAAPLEKPVTVLFGAVTEAGAPVAMAAMATSGYRVTRRSAPGAPPEVWDDGSKTWLPDQPGTGAKPVALMYKDGDPNPWQGLLVAAGVKDASGAAAFAKAVAGYPVYAVAGTFTGKDGAAGDSHPSASVTFAGAADRNLAVVGPGDGEEPDQATVARVLLKSPAMQVIGGLTIARNSPGAAVQLSNAAGAGVLLHPDGSIELNPAPGKGVRINGDLDVDHVTYQPAGGGLRQEL